MSETEFDYIFTFTKYLLLVSGVYIPNTYKNKFIKRFLNNCLYYSNLIILYGVIIGEIHATIDEILIGKNVVEISIIMPCTIISVLGSIKALFLYLNKDILQDNLNSLKKIYPSDLNLEYEECGVNKAERIIKESMLILKFVVFLFVSISLVLVAMICFTPLVMMATNYYKTGEWMIKYPFLVKYFFDITQWSYFIYVHQVWATLIVVVFVFGCDTLYYALCVHISMNFRLLGLQFENVVTNSMSETRGKLSKAIVIHQELMRLVNQTELLYSKSSLFNIITSSVLICLSAFNITVVDDISTFLTFLAFLATSFEQVALICYFGDMLMKSSTDISMSVYKSGWANSDSEVKKTMLLVIIRSQRPTKLTAWNFADLNLRAFTTILSRSWSYFALLKTVYK